MAIDYVLCCDECGKVIDASMKSAAAARRSARRQNLLHRYKRKEICTCCLEDFIQLPAILPPS